MSGVITRSMPDAIDLLNSATRSTCAIITYGEQEAVSDRVLVAVPDDAAMAMEIAETLLRTRTLDVLVVDAAMCAGPRFATCLALVDGSMTTLVLAHRGVQ